MRTSKTDTFLKSPKNQLKLFGYNEYFTFFKKIVAKGDFPNAILFSGAKGSGKATFAYHLINYILSKGEKDEYSLDDFEINKNNSTYNLMNQQTHPNFFLIENHDSEKNIKIEKVRNLLKFASKSTYSKDIKIILIDNAEFLNLNSSNALLKAIEEPQKNTHFIIIHNSAYKILDTIKSRCKEFKLFFKFQEKKEIFEKLLNQYDNDVSTIITNDDLYFDTPGNLIKYFFAFKDSNINFQVDRLESILFFIDKLKNEKDYESLSFLCSFIEKFYNDLCIRNKNNSNSYFFNKHKILTQLKNMKKFNLNEKNLLISIKDILLNEIR